MSDADKIKHSAACLKEIRRLCDALQTNPDEGKKNGYARKIHQLCGYCLDHLGQETPRRNFVPSDEDRANVLARLKARNGNAASNG